MTLHPPPRPAAPSHHPAHCRLPPGRYVWESKADGSFAISEDSEGEPLGRGTQINISLKARRRGARQGAAGLCRPSAAAFPAGRARLAPPRLLGLRRLRRLPAT